MKFRQILALIIGIFTSVHFYAQTTYVFFGSFNSDKSAEGIYVYQLNMNSGKLSKVTSVRNVLNSSYLTLSPDGKYVFACTESKTKNAGSVSSFEFNPEKKTLTYINSQKSGGENLVYITVHKNGKCLMSRNYTEGSASVYPVSENGMIQPYVQNFQFSEGSVNPGRQDRAHIHSTVFSPDYQYVLMPDLGADKIRGYRFENNKQEPLSEIPFTPAVLGSGPRHFTFHPNRKFAYCIEEIGGAVSTYTYEDGKLNNLQRIITHPDTYKGDYESSDIHISPDGRYLYASNRGKENNITIFSVQKDGILKPVGYQPVKGKHPRVFTIDLSGKFLIVANTGSGKAVVFKREPETGLLKKTGKTKIENVSTIQVRAY